MLLDDAHEWLGWPRPQDILDPPGEGAKVYQDFARRKLEAALKRESPQLVLRTGVLAANPHAADSSAPLAVVCDFQRGATDRVLDEAHRLAWSLSRTALLVTLEPHRLIAWSCYIDPNQPSEQRQLCVLPTPNGFSPTGSPEQRSVRDLLHWVSLITGHFQRQCPEKFRADGRADELLLKNLRYVRRKLRNEMGLSQEYCHDLLARIIFTQFLFHRRDSDGTPFFSASLLERLQGDVLRNKHETLPSILRDKDDTYSLFRWLDARFNGDLFPGKVDSTDEEREIAWQGERDAVRPEHLALLADLVSGTIDTTDRQLQLWPRYSFDVIPLEFISSVYEEFLNEAKYKNKAFYTPAHLVDYVLDAVLPWQGDDWNLRILDPSCGSGIFLVKAFQRLIYRWRRATGREPLVSDLKPILAENLVGVDINPEAVRVASFSLYLAMADAIEPKHYVTREKVFPRLRGTRLIANDFFDETTPGYRTKEDSKSFDLVIGNAPWGESSIKKTSAAAPTDDRGHQYVSNEGPTKAALWAGRHSWPVVNYDIGPLFLAKGLELIGRNRSPALT
ncbi:MAG TPA: N-6 DNA methylase [Gemmataceae bacterium]|nr:N-6 DNA methylase [Gemmataceae bacterium]